MQYKSGTGTWTTIGSFTSGTDFTNGSFYSVNVTVPNFVPTAAGSMRIQCDASDNSDQVFIDAVTIVKLNGAAFIESGVMVQQVEKTDVVPAQDPEAGKELIVYPNPASDELNIVFKKQIQSTRILSIHGQDVSGVVMKGTESLIDIQKLTPGMYLVYVMSDGIWSQAKFCKL